MKRDGVFILQFLFTYFLLEIILLLSPLTYSQSPQFYLTDSLHIPRADHTAITLKDSNVLVIGGFNDEARICEIYDHQSNRWFFADTINTYISGEAVLLENGNVLFVCDIEKKSEIYDYNTDRWVIANEPNFQRQYGHKLTLLSDGKVLLSGGYSFENDTRALNKCEIFDPQNNSWSIIDNLNFARYDHTSTLLNDGRVFVCGGAGRSQSLKSCELYDPITNEWLIADSMDIDRIGHTATLLPDGRVLVAGGMSRNELALSSVEIYDPLLNKWESVTSLNLRKTFHYAFVISNNKILFAGGAFGYDKFEIYDFILLRSDYMGYIQNAREVAAFAQIDKNTVLSIGGISWYDDFLSPSKLCNIFGYETVPVELTSFQVTSSENYVELRWVTATETNNKGFEIQRSEVGSQKPELEKIGFVDGHGTATESKEYSFIDKNITSGKYLYRLKQIDFDGSFEYSNVVEVNIGLPKKFNLEQNYPNPFNPSTTISYALPYQSSVELTIYDIMGREVRSFNVIQSAGKQNIVWDGKNSNNENISSGIYLYRLRLKSLENNEVFEKSAKLMMLK